MPFSVSIIQRIVRVRAYYMYASKKRNNQRPFWSCVRGKLGQGNHVIKCLQSILKCKDSVFKYVRVDLILDLKGHCHVIWQLHKKLKGVFASTEFQN